MLEISMSENFNGCYMIVKAESIMVIWKNQAKKLVLVNSKDNTKK